MASNLRRDQALLTQQRIIEAMGELLHERGYTATTIAAVAERAGVSVPTVYRTFGSKPALVRRLYEATLAGDDTYPRLKADRRDLGPNPSPTLRLHLLKYAELASENASRTASLIEQLTVAARAGDPEVRAIVQSVLADRLESIRTFSQGLAAFGVDPDHAVDILWALSSPDLYQRLVQERGWSTGRFRAWLADTLADLVTHP